jgi:hypothetical protein
MSKTHHNQNKKWSPQDDQWLIENRHKGVDYLMQHLDRSRKAIKQRFSTLEKQGKIQETIVVKLKDLAQNIELGEQAVAITESAENRVISVLQTEQAKYMELVDWACHIIKTYGEVIDPTDVELLLLVTGVHSPDEENKAA